ncbi:MAG: transcriptional repressor [Rikenellaceae bacterium]|nr:transcriptional repressor [Rikenellaceae bacterium]
MVDIQRYLTEHGVKPSVQRLAIMEYLHSHRTHPTVEDIYSALSPSMPTLSKTTVYNTVYLLAASGAISRLDIESGTSRFDAETVPHSHFYCRCCGRVTDLPAADTGLGACLPAGCRVESLQVNFTGVCSDCCGKGLDKTDKKPNV